MESWEVAVTIAGLALITLLTRGFFLLPERDIPLPGWLQQGLRYAPLAAMAAIIVPELLMPGGRLVASWQDARLLGAAAGAATWFWRRGILSTIVVGMATMLLARAAFGW